MTFIFYSYQCLLEGEDPSIAISTSISSSNPYNRRLATNSIMKIAPVAPEAFTPPTDTDTRSTWSIAWSCLTVIFACTWISVHPNVPAFDDTRLSIIRRRLRLMLTALIAPELVLLWAYRQWVGARDIGHHWEIGKGTTTQQGFFMLMGGFVDRSRKPIDPQNFSQNPFELAQIDDEDISDRSKSDFLSKSIAFLQTTWFVVQCVARSATPGLAITEIEVATLGFAALSAVQYILWLKKPLDVHRPIVLVNADVRVRTSFADDELQPTPHPLPPVLRPILTLTSIFGDPTYCSHIPPQAKRVPTFYAPPITQNQMLGSYMFAAVTGAMFGAFHFLAWSLDFPTVYELHFWRVATVITASYPVMLFLYLWLVQSGWDESKMFGDKPSPAIWKFFFDVCVILGLLAYIVSRVILMTLACTTLRHVPTGSERKIGWAMHIPHL